MEREIETGWEWREHNRAKVLACLQEGEYEAIVTTGQSELDGLAHLAAELGILEAVQLLTVKRERAGIPDELLLIDIILKCGTLTRWQENDTSN